MNYTEYNILNSMGKKRKPLSVEYKKKTALSEHELQCWAHQYFSRVLPKEEGKYIGHEGSIGLGRMTITEKDSAVSVAFKTQYNKFFDQFVYPIQKKFKAKGIERGQPDGFLFHKKGVVSLEFKVGYNKPFTEQRAFAEDMALLGHPTEYPRTQEDVMAIPRKYGIRTIDKGNY